MQTWAFVNMNLSLPPLYRDELVYSAFARHFAYMQPSALISAYRSIDDHKWFSTRYVRGAARLAEEARVAWGLSALQILDRHTLLPFNAAFLKPEVHLKCTECFMANNPHDGTTVLGMSNACVADGKFLRFCASCLDEDLRSYGETYWHRKHQLSGTIVCVRHDELLRDSTALMSPRGNGMQDATEHCHKSCMASVSLSSNEMSSALLIAGRSAKLLSGGLGPWLNPDVGFEYQRSAIEIGYGIGTTKLNTKRFGRDLISYFGASFLQKLGCRLSVNSAALRKIFYDTGTNHPLIHVLVQLFLENGLQTSRSALKTQDVDGTFRQDWRCPNVYAKHDESFRIPDVCLRRTKQGALYYHARCSCGFVFAFAKSRQDDPCVPLVSKMSGYGEAIEIEVRRLFAQYGSMLKVCQEMNLPYTAVRRSLERSRNLFESSPEKIKLLRDSWLTTRSKSTYQALLRHDRAWILGRRNQRGRRAETSPNCRANRTIFRVQPASTSAVARLQGNGKIVTDFGHGNALDRSSNAAARGTKAPC